MDTKRLGRVDIKSAGKGEFTAVIARYGVIDKDGDVTIPGAHKDGATVVVSAYGHQSWGGALPVGKATLRTDGTKTVAEGQFFMDTSHGRDTFETVKQLGDMGQWSYGFDVVDSEMGEKDGQRVRFLKAQDIHEVSPVLIGAGVDTRTLSTKSAKETAVDAVQYKAAIRPHPTATTAREWDVKSVLAGIADTATVNDLRSVHAWVNPGGDPESKTAYLFPHHHGIDGPANMRAVVFGIAALNGTKSGIPDQDRQAVYEHLASHLRDAGREVPALKAAPGGDPTFLEEAIDTLSGVSDLLVKAQRVVALRAAKGKNLSHVNTEFLGWIKDDVDELLKQFTVLLDTPREQAAVEYVRFIAQQHKENPR